MTTTIKDLYAAPVSTPEAYEALIADLLDSDDTIQDISLDSRFDDLDAEQVSTLVEWFIDNGKLALVRVSTIEMALFLLGADPEGVEPDRDPYNYVRGKGKDRTYYWCSRNLHNRNEKTSNLGDIEKGGLAHDLANGFFVPGPQAVIDCTGVILSLQHRIKAAIKVYDETGEFPSMDLLCLVGFPTPLAGVLDRGARKTDSDQEVMDTRQFRPEFIEAILGKDDSPADVVKARDTFSKILVTVRNNLWSRFNGTGYHPSGAHQPTDRQARTLQKCFDPSETDAGHDALQELIVQVWGAAQDSAWKTNLPPAMVSAAIVLASNADKEERWEPTATIDVDPDLRDKVLKALGLVSQEGEDVLSSFNREVAAIKKLPKKPTGLDRWVFWGFVQAVADVVQEVEPEEGHKYMPSITAKFVESVKKGRKQAPVFGGYDMGPKADSEED